MLFFLCILFKLSYSINLYHIFINCETPRIDELYAYDTPKRQVDSLFWTRIRTRPTPGHTYPTIMALSRVPHRERQMGTNETCTVHVGCKVLHFLRRIHKTRVTGWLVRVTKFKGGIHLTRIPGQCDHEETTRCPPRESVLGVLIFISVSFCYDVPQEVKRLSRLDVFSLCMWM